MMTNEQLIVECGKKGSWPNLRYQPNIFPEGTKKKYEKPQSGQPVSGPIFEPQDLRHTK
jgi:hypothetical protein